MTEGERRFFECCGNRVIPCLPVAGGHDVLRVFAGPDEPVGLALKGRSDVQAGVEGNCTMNGICTNHSVLTCGILLEIYRRNVSVGGSGFTALTRMVQYDFLMREAGFSRIDEIRGIAVVPVMDYSGWELRRGGAGWDFVEADAGEAPYTATYVMGPTREASWVVLHRVPYPIWLGPSAGWMYV